MNPIAEVFADIKNIVKTEMIGGDRKEMLQKYYLAPRGSITATFLERAIVALRHGVSHDEAAAVQEKMQSAEIHHINVGVRARTLVNEILEIRSLKLAQTRNQILINPTPRGVGKTECIERAVVHAAQCDNIMLIGAFVTRYRDCGMVSTSMVYEARWLELMREYTPVNIMC